ncbi:MAG: sugar ABC transporter permease [Spirochaetia bacterium]
MKRAKTDSRRMSRTAYSFLLPAVVAIFLVIIVPMVLAIFITFHDVNLVETGGAMIPNGARNFVTLFKDHRFFHSIVISLLYVVTAVSIETVLSVAIALLLDRKFHGRNLVRTLIIIPMFITPVVVGLSWRMFYDPTSGIINYLLGVLGLGTRHDWLGNASIALPAIVLADVWEWTPFMILIVLAGLESIPQELYEAAVVDGTTRMTAIRYISIPLVLPAIVVAMIFRVVDAMKAFDLIYVMTKGGPGLATETTNLYAYTIGFQYFRIGYATTVALVFTVIATAVSSAFVSRLFRQSRA